MSRYFDDLETRSADAREAAQAKALLDIIRRVQAVENSCLSGGDTVQSPADLVHLPVLRKSDLSGWQRDVPPFGVWRDAYVKRHPHLSIAGADL